MFTGIPNDKGDNWVIITGNNRNTNGDYNGNIDKKKNSNDDTIMAITIVITIIVQQ